MAGPGDSATALPPLGIGMAELGAGVMSPAALEGDIAASSSIAAGAMPV
jgi:hypothetical protein